MILHITNLVEWENAQKTGEYIAKSLEIDGFIHCSTIKQTVNTANNFFKGQKGLILLCIDENELKSECKYEDPSGKGEHDPKLGALFPHIYGPINVSAVIKVLNFHPGANGFFELPKELINLS